MSPKKSKTAKPSLKKKGTMAATAATGKEFLKQTWGESYVNEFDASLAAPATKPKLSKSRTIQNTTQEAKALLGTEVLADTRTETKRRQASAKAKKTAAKPKRKPALKRLGTMAKTATEGKAYVKQAGKKKATTGRKRTGGRAKKSSK